MLDRLRRGLVNRIAGDVIREQKAEIHALKAEMEGLASVSSKTPGWDNEGWQSLRREVESEDRNFVEWQADVGEAERERLAVGLAAGQTSGEHHAEKKDGRNTSLWVLGPHGLISLTGLCGVKLLARSG